jgi:LPS O-antigen subunit length determinant protein (WzzB/FepE family)
MNDKPSNDYIDLAEILVFFWDNKLKIIIVTFLFVFLAVGINIIFPKHYISSTPVAQIAEKDYLSYGSNNLIKAIQKRLVIFEHEHDLNLLAGLESAQYENIKNRQANEQGMSVSQIIDRGYFYNMFIEEVKNINNIKEAFAETEIFKNKYKDPDLYDEALTNAAMKFETKIDKDTGRITLSYPAKSKQKYILVLHKLSKLATERVRLTLIQQTEEIIRQYKEQKRILLSELDKAEKNARLDFETQKKIQMRLLSEQIEIAKSQGFSKIESYQKGDILQNFSYTVGNYPYLKGYIALEKELTFLINSKPGDDADIRVILKKKRALSEDTVLERTQQVIASLPFMDKEKEFVAVNFEPLNTKFKDSRSYITLIIIFLLLGIIMGTLYSVVTRPKK